MSKKVLVCTLVLLSGACKGTTDAVIGGSQQVEVRTEFSPSTMRCSSPQFQQLWLTDPAAGCEELLLDGYALFKDADERERAKNPWPTDWSNRECCRSDFMDPQLSVDNESVFFLSQRWVTSHALQAIDVRTKEVRFVCHAISFEVVRNGPHCGSLRVTQRGYHASQGSFSATSILDVNGQEIERL
jgi:hypothetical protein